METNKFIEKYLSDDKNFIKKIGRKNELKEEEDFYKLLELWLEKSDEITIGDLRKYNGNTKLILLEIDSGSYYLNADTKKFGVLEFIKNKNNPFKIIPNSKGKLNKITNRSDSEPIKGFYLYKKI